MQLLLLDKAGLLSALVLGIVVFYFGGAHGLQFLLLVLTFLIAGVLVTKYDYARKRELAVFEHERSWENVLANGTVPALCVVACHFNPAFFGAYVVSLAAITADKFGSELGVLGGRPYSLPFFNRVKPGISGAVSSLGCLVSFDGAVLIGAAAYFVFPGTFSFIDVLLIGVLGFLGSFADSLVGILEVRGFGNKSTTNIICSLAGAALGYIFFA